MSEPLRRPTAEISGGNVRSDHLVELLAPAAVVIVFLGRELGRVILAPAAPAEPKGRKHLASIDCVEEIAESRRPQRAHRRPVARIDAV